MKHVAMVMASLAISAVLTGPLEAQAAGNPTCNEVRWKAEILHKYPGIEKACVGVVVRDNINYVRVSGKVKSKANGVLRVKLDNTTSEITWKPAKEDTVSIEGKPVPAMDVVVGQSLRFYMPEDRVAVVDISDKGVNPREVLP